MKILIIEDEKHNAARLQRLLQEFNLRIEVVGILETVKESVDWLNTNIAPDVILMDVRLADGLSFDIFLQTRLTSPVVFTTAYDEYAVRAFKVNSIDYLLKPVEKQELFAALQKVQSLKSDQIKPDTAVNPGFEHLLEFFKNKAVTYRKRFLLPVYNGYKTLPVEDIDFIYSEYKITHLVLQNGKTETVQQSMEDLEEELDPSVFFRANRQMIISVQSIERILNNINGKLNIVLKRNKEKEVLISREKAPLFKTWLDR